MTGYQSIPEMMRNCAEDAVQDAKERFGFSLDYTSGSIESLETILASVSSEIDASDTDALEKTVKKWGGYFGETVRRSFGGSWDLIQYPGKAVAVPTLIVGESQLYPLVKVYRRLTLGEDENVWKFYGSIHVKLAGAQTKGEPDA